MSTIGLVEHSPFLFSHGEPSSSKATRVLEDGAPTPQSSDDMEDDVSSVDSKEVDIVLCDMMSDVESTYLETNDDEDLPKVIPEDDDETLDDLYMPPYEADSPSFVQIDLIWRKTALGNMFCSTGAKAFAFPDGYELLMPSEGCRVTDCHPGHVAVYRHMLDFGLGFPLDPFIVKIFKVCNICLSQITPLGWRNFIAYSWTFRYKRFPETLNLFWKLYWIKEDGSAKGKGMGKRKRSTATKNLAKAVGCPCIPRVVS